MYVSLYMSECVCLSGWVCMSECMCVRIYVCVSQHRFLFLFHSLTETLSSSLQLKN